MHYCLMLGNLSLFRIYQLKKNERRVMEVAKSSSDPDLGLGVISLPSVCNENITKKWVK